MRRLQPGQDQLFGPVAGQFGPLRRAETGYRIVFITGTHSGQTGRDVPGGRPMGWPLPMQWTSWFCSGLACHSASVMGSDPAGN